MASGPVIIGFDGSPAAERAVRKSAELIDSKPALVVTVWEAGQAFGYTEMPVDLGVPLPPIDIRTATELDQAMATAAQQTAQRGAAIAKEAGFEAEGLAVADEITVAETLVRLSRERNASGIVVGSRGRGALQELVLGSTSQGVVHRADCPVVVVRYDEKRH